MYIIKFWLKYSDSIFVLQHSWYFFEALVKSMAHYLIECGKVKVSRASV